MVLYEVWYFAPIFDKVSPDLILYVVVAAEAVNSHIVEKSIIELSATADILNFFTIVPPYNFHTWSIIKGRDSSYILITSNLYYKIIPILQFGKNITESE